MTINLTTPVGRIVQGDLAKAQPVLDKVTKQQKHTRDGRPMIQHFISLAIPKTPGHTHWAQTDWGKQIWDEGNRAHPTFASHPAFSWKIEDGDSVIPNKKGKKNCDREGFPGNWIVKLRQGFLPKTYTTVGWVADGNPPPAIPADGIRCGYYAQVNITVEGNDGDSPGVYLNPSMVALSGYGENIIAGPDASEAGFGAAPLPPGASATPIGGFVPPPAAGGAPGTVPTGMAPAVPFAAATTAANPYPPVSTAPTGFAAGVVPTSPSNVPPSFAGPTPTPSPVPAATPMTSPSNAPPPINPAFLAPPPPPAVPAAPPAKQLTAKAAGASYADLIKAGWNDALLVVHGMMLP